MTEESKKSVKEWAEEYFNALPEDLEVEGFDNFFVGDEAETLMSQGSRRSHFFQGMVHDDVNVEMEDDLDEFCPNPEICTSESALLVFHRVKESIFDRFGFIEFKSREFSHPVRKEDLIVTEDDRYLVDYLIKMQADIQTVGSIASLVAFREMRVLDVQFVKECKCPICNAFNGTIFNINEALAVLCSGEQLVHKGCCCEWVPIFDRKQEYKFSVDEEVWENWASGSVYIYKNVPLELKDDLVGVFVNTLVFFVDVRTVFEEDYMDASLGFPVVFRSEDGVLYVHNGYIDGLGPVNYLKKFVEELKTEEVANKAIFLYQGKEVYSKDGLYYDVETGEVLR